MLEDEGNLNWEMELSSIGRNGFWMKNSADDYCEDYLPNRVSET